MSRSATPATPSSTSPSPAGGPCAGTPRRRWPRLAGQRLVGVGRHGKYLLFEWEDGRVLVVHLRMSGQLLAAAAGDPRPLHTHAVLAFGGAGELRFVDPRTFGELFLAGPAPGTGPDGGAGRRPGRARPPRPRRPGRRRRPPAGGAGPSARPAQGRPGRPAGPGRAGQHLRRRGLLRGRFAPRPRRPARSRPTRSAAWPGRCARCWRRRSRAGALRCGTSSTATSTATRAVTSSTTRCTAGRGCPARAAGSPSSG